MMLLAEPTHIQWFAVVVVVSLHCILPTHLAGLFDQFAVPDRVGYYRPSLVAIWVTLLICSKMVAMSIIEAWALPILTVVLKLLLVILEVSTPAV